MPNMILTLKGLSFEVKGAWLLASIPDPYWAAAGWLGTTREWREL